MNSHEWNLLAQQRSRRINQLEQENDKLREGIRQHRRHHEECPGGDLRCGACERGCELLWTLLDEDG